MTETLEQKGTPELECCVLWWQWSRETVRQTDSDRDRDITAKRDTRPGMLCIVTAMIMRNSKTDRQTETLQQKETPYLECCVLWWRWSREESFSSWPACWPVAAAAAVCCTMMMMMKRTMIRDPHTAVYWVAHHHASLTQPLAHSELTVLWFHLAQEKIKNNKHHSELIFCCCWSNSSSCWLWLKKKKKKIKSGIKHQL